MGPDEFIVQLMRRGFSYSEETERWKGPDGKELELGPTEMKKLKALHGPDLFEAILAKVDEEISKPAAKRKV